MKKFITVILVLILVAGGYWFFVMRGNEQAEPNEQTDSDQSEEIETFDRNQHPLDEPGSIWWIVNKERSVPDDYTPAELTAPDIRLRWDETAESMQVDARIAGPLEALYQDALDSDYELMLISGYRSEEYQRQLYENYVRQHGQEEAERFSARPGTSEHQTGLVVDLGRVDGECEIQECFGETPEGEWLADNAYRYGFIVRYLEDKEDVTGYMYEPWHFRYVGEELARELYGSNRTMEEFFGLQ